MDWCLSLVPADGSHRSSALCTQRSHWARVERLGCTLLCSCVAPGQACLPWYMQPVSSGSHNQPVEMLQISDGMCLPTLSAMLNLAGGPEPQKMAVVHLLDQLLPELRLVPRGVASCWSGCCAELGDRQGDGTLYLSTVALCCSHYTTWACSWLYKKLQSPPL